MKVVLDENVPLPLRQFLNDFEVFSVHYLGLAGLKNGELISKLDAEYDVFILADKNLRYQQNLLERKISLIELPTNRWPVIKTIIPRIHRAILQSKPGSYTIIES